MNDCCILFVKNIAYHFVFVILYMFVHLMKGRDVNDGSSSYTAL